MAVTATELDFSRLASSRRAAKGPAIDVTPWGYAIHEPTPASTLLAVVQAIGRFVGTLFLIAAAALLVLPDSAQGPGVFGMKFAATISSGLLGFAMMRAGRPVRHPEIHVDLTRHEVRVGRRSLKGAFRRKATLAFCDVGSVYLLRSKDQSQPTRLFLRLTGTDAAIEVASGPVAALETLRERLAADLTRQPRGAATPPPQVQPAREPVREARPPVRPRRVA